MYCPLCGKKLEDVEQESTEEVDKESQLYRTDLMCPSGCFGKDYPLYFHHPFGGLNSAPGDSWSLSWVK